MTENKLNIFVHWLPGIVLFLKIYSIIGDSLFDIWRNMLVGEIPKGVTNHKYDQSKQILSDTDIYNRKIYREYNEAWQQLYRCLEKVISL